MFILAFCISFMLHAQEKQPETVSLSLKQAQEYALENNANAKNSLIDQELAKKKIWETLAIGMPQLNAKANYQHLFKLTEIRFGDAPPILVGEQDNVTFDITLSQLIFSGEYLIGVQASKVYSLLSDQAKTKSDLDIRESVANTYSLSLVMRQSRNTLSQSLENVNKTLTEMQAMYKQGFIENTDVDQMELNSLNLTNSFNTLQKQVEAIGNLLKFQINK